MNRVGIVVNPIAGAAGYRPETGSLREARARRALDAAGVAGTVVVSPGKGRAAELVRALIAQGADRIIAWGGDGTINEVATPLIGTTTVLGIVRSGSGDGLGRTLGVPLDPEAAIARALGSAVGAIDVGYLDGRPFFNLAGIGFDATVGAAFNRGRRRGTWSYIRQTVQTLWTYQAERYRIQIGAEASDATRFAIAFANGREYGNHMVLSADADPSDGWLEAVILDDGRFLRQLWRLRRLAFGLRKPAEGIFRYRIQTARVSGDRLRCHVDGETFETTGVVEVGMRPKALRVAGAQDGR